MRARGYFQTSYIDLAQMVTLNDNVCYMPNILESVYLYNLIVESLAIHDVYILRLKSKFSYLAS